MKRVLSEARRTNDDCADYYEKVMDGHALHGDRKFFIEDLHLMDKLAKRLSAKKRLSKIEVRTAFAAYYRGFQKAADQARAREQTRIAAEKSGQGAG
jgi:Fic family protein